MDSASEYETIIHVTKGEDFLTIIKNNMIIPLFTSETSVVFGDMEGKHCGCNGFDWRISGGHAKTRNNVKMSPELFADFAGR